MKWFPGQVLTYQITNLMNLCCVLSSDVTGHCENPGDSDPSFYSTCQSSNEQSCGTGGHRSRCGACAVCLFQEGMFVYTVAHLSHLFTSSVQQNVIISVLFRDIDIHGIYRPLLIDLLYLCCTLVNFIFIK